MDSLDNEPIRAVGTNGFIEMDINGAKKDNIVNDVETGLDWKFRNSNFEKIFSKEAGAATIEDLDVNERKIVEK